ncbi:hypothetical protein HETIRDRAFT_422768 [Heterobasidion irregulare TC 32-1]|uniref:Uncharacterized protein n=1 Tax=Heterobasidion irregulare (strain TC 32-1) TaxID=747525 RepID=W4JRN9_HETIT|nr:uncharacterized protein HETIRDRAFT_422768 [Heterobasidion irregulare TC 32-1]ETW76203.1 hypothetical protein HETIRDRAFT_422768 [Heterobasidion irregulare TC 32-1]
MFFTFFIPNHRPFDVGKPDVALFFWITFCIKETTISPPRSLTLVILAVVVRATSSPLPSWALCGRMLFVTGPSLR